MAFKTLDPSEFLDDNVFRQDAFMRKVENRDWSVFEGKRVLVRGCASAIMPPWALMLLTSKLLPFAKSIHYGNDHENMVVYKHE